MKILLSLLSLMTLIFFFQNCDSPQWKAASSNSSSLSNPIDNTLSKNSFLGTSIAAWPGLLLKSAENTLDLSSGDYVFVATINNGTPSLPFQIDFNIGNELFSVNETTLKTSSEFYMSFRSSQASEVKVSWKTLNGKAKVQLLEIFKVKNSTAPQALSEIKFKPAPALLKPGRLIYLHKKDFMYGPPFNLKDDAICVGQAAQEGNPLSLEIHSSQAQIGYLWAMVKAESVAENSYSVRANGSNDIWHIPVAKGYTWQPVGAQGQGHIDSPEFTNRPFQFQPGTNTINIFQREAGCIKSFVVSTNINFNPESLENSESGGLRLFELDPSQLLKMGIHNEVVDLSDDRKQGVLVDTDPSVTAVDIYLNGVYRNRESIKPFKFILNSLPTDSLHKLEFIGLSATEEIMTRQSLSVTVRRKTTSISNENSKPDPDTLPQQEHSSGSSISPTELIAPSKITYGRIRDFSAAPSCQNSPTHNFLKTLNGRLASMKAKLSQVSPCSQRYQPHWSMNLIREGLGMTAVDYFRTYHGNIMRQNELDCVGNSCPGLDINGTFTIAEGPPKNGESKERIALQRNIVPGVVPNSFFAFDNFNQPKDRICISLEVFIPNDFVGNQVGSYKLAYGIWGGEKAIGGGTSPLNQKGYVVRNVWNGNSTRLYSYHLNRGYGTWARQSASKCDSSQCCLYGDQGADAKIARGRWVSIEQEVVLNNKNQADGYARLWVDGAQVNEVTGMLIYENQRNMKIRGLFMNDMWGGYHAAEKNKATKTEKYWYTNYQVYY